ncbi:MAG TPA: hypothetical protein VEA60_07485, partial [Allosphingosinicella sp.]|nr:hypothetical protein [Allosphingosinicella sp.]
MTTPYTLGELDALVARLDPAKLLFVRTPADLDDDARRELGQRLVRSADPRQRLANVEYLLLLMHQARAVDSPAYLKTVYLPWIGLRRRTEAHRRRIGDEFARMEAFEAYSEADATHIAVHIYRPLASDMLDVYLTLLMATYAFQAGNFVDIQTSNLSAGERNKVEYLEARIREAGGPASLLAGYDPIVRNAVSHAGSEGLVFEPGVVIFRDIKRQTPPVVQARRWTHDELSVHVLQLLEFLSSVDAAAELFGFDCLSLLDTDYETSAQVMTVALTAGQRAALRARQAEVLDRIRLDATRSLQERFADLSRILFHECAQRNIPCRNAAYNAEHRTAFVQVPLGAAIQDDDEIPGRVAELTRYAVLARGVFGSLFETFAVRAMDGEQVALALALAGAALDDYAEERAGLIDLIREARILHDDQPLSLVVDEAALEAAEDATLGRRFPRRGRPGRWA